MENGPKVVRAGLIYFSPVVRDPLCTYITYCAIVYKTVPTQVNNGAS